jgi:large subunit ribosomal protein L30
MGKLEITLVRSIADKSAKQQGTIRALGLKRPHQTVVQEDRPEIRGMVEAVKHLVEVEERDK